MTSFPLSKVSSSSNPRGFWLLFVIFVWPDGPRFPLFFFFNLIWIFSKISLITRLLRTFGYFSLKFRPTVVPNKNANYFGILTRQEGVNEAATYRPEWRTFQQKQVRVISYTHTHASVYIYEKHTHTCMHIWQFGRSSTVQFLVGIQFFNSSSGIAS